jgi:methylmalonyl-CoA mutase
MPEEIPLRLREQFPAVPTSEWDALIRADLNAADSDRTLLWRPDDRVTVKPFYRAEDLADLGVDLHAPPGAFPFLRGSGVPWAIDETFTPPAAAIRADEWHDQGATAVQEIAWAVAAGVDRLAERTASGTSVDEAASSTTFVFAVGSVYFLEIAKLRAARLAWAQAVMAFGTADPSSARARVHVRTARINKSLYDPYTNLLRATTEALSAAIGGCDRLAVEAFGFDEHLAVNVQRILKEESFIDAVADPAGGSYYVEALTDALARAAWTELQQVEADGGFAAVLAAGAIPARLAASRAAREDAVAARRRTLVGVNNYPNVAEKAPTISHVPAGAVSTWRLAAPLEAIRDRTARHAQATGRFPRVLLVTRGDVKMRGARANFCFNFFGCGGFDVETSTEYAGHAADLIVLCSSDAEYLPLAQEVCAAVHVPVLVAGDPGDQADALVAAGVQGFVHAGSDIVQTLTLWQDALGMGAAARSMP